MNRHRIAVFGMLVCLFVLGFSDTAQAQNTICVGQPCGSSATLIFSSVPAGTTSSPQTVPVTTMNATTVAITVSPANSWLVVNNGQTLLNTGGSGNPSSVPVQVDAHMLSPSQTAYSGTITFTINQTSIKATVNVSATVSSGSALSASPPSISFTATQGANVGNPTSTPVTISSTAGPLGYTSTTATQAGTGNWLLLTNPTGTTGSGTGITVSVNPSSLMPGTYTGTITVASATTSDIATVSVTLTVAANATLSVAPTTLPAFLYQIGQALPPPQSLTLTASSGSVNFSISTTPNWLIPNITSGTANPTATVTLSVNPNGLSAGVYSNSLIITPSGGSPLPGITVTLVVSNNPLLKLSVSALSYSAQFAAQNPPDQQVQVTTSGGSGSVGFSFSSDSPWLSVPSATGSATPATLTVRVSTQGLPVGTVTGTITVRPTNGDSYSESIVVTLTVGNASTVVAGPPTLLFSFEIGQSMTPPPQLVALTSLGQPATFTLSPSGGGTCGNNWLQASSLASSTPATITVTVNATGMPAGLCSGTVTVNYNSGSGNTALAIPVTLQIATTALLNIGFPATPNGFGLEVVQQNASTITRSLTLTSTDPVTAANFSVSAASGANNWLFVSPSGFLQTPQQLSVAIVPAGLPPGTYTGTITFSPSFNPPSLLADVTIAITLVVNPNVTVTVSPAGPLTFTVAQNGPLPPAQTLTLASSGGAGATFTATVTPVTGGTWVQVSPASGQASGQLNVSLVQGTASTLTPGQYTNQITLAFQNSATAAITIAVNLTVGPPQTVSVSPASSLSFSYQLGSGQTPPSQMLQVTSTGGPVQVSVGTTSTGWLSATPSGGATPLTVTVQVNTQVLTIAGTLTGTVSISAPGVLANPTTVNVTLTVIALPPPNPLTITNAASSAPGAIAPGELITIKGMQLGPTLATSFRVNAAGSVDSSLGGVQVLFDNIPGTPIYVSSGQINVIVPYEIAGRLSTNVVVQYQNQQSPPIQQIVAAVAPSIFTLNTTGQGQGAVLNQDYSINGPLGGVLVSGGVVIPTTPASAGSVIAVYATGGGQTSPPSLTGSVAPATSLRPLPAGVAVTATIGGQPAVIDFAGSAPTLVSGVIQVNIEVPSGVTGDNLPIVITIGGASTPLGVTVAVR